MSTKRTTFSKDKGHLQIIKRLIALITFFATIITYAILAIFIFT